MKFKKLPTKPPSDTNEEQIRKKGAELISKIGDLQLMLYAENKKSLLVILQGMDASGKDGAIKHVFEATNPIAIRN